MSRPVQYICVLVLLLLATGSASAQYIDTVCANEQHAMYRTGARAGSVFYWSVEGGAIDSTSDDGSAIWVNWGTIPGAKKIIVQEISKDGCKGKPVEALVLLWPVGNVRIFGPDEVCRGEQATLEATGGADKYLWTTGHTTDIITIAAQNDTTVGVTGYFGECAVSTSLHELRVKYRPIADFEYSPDEPTIGDTLNFEYTGTNNVDYWTWEFRQRNRPNGISDLENPQYSFSTPGIITVHLTVENEFGCTDTITKYIVIKAGINVFIPSGFTPNRDGLNNVFKPVYENIRTTEFMVIDRWGEIMFRTNSLDEGWDGTYKGVAVPDGVFTYLVKVVGFDDKSYAFNGTVTLIR